MTPPDLKPSRSTVSVDADATSDEAGPTKQNLRGPDPVDLERYVEDFAKLAPLEESAVDDYEKVCNLDVWKPTPYEEQFLPGLRLAGLSGREHVTLQNTADLHMHTEYSDGDTIDRVLTAAEEAHLDVIAITDHDEIEGAHVARRLVHERRLKVAVIPAIEVSSSEGHIGGLFVMKKIPANLSAQETVDRIHAAGGLAVAHHPFAPPFIERMLGLRLGCGELVQTVNFDAIEGTNAVPGYGRRFNIEAHEALKRRRVRIGITGSSDAHDARLIGKGRTYFAGNSGVTSLFSGLQHGFVEGAEGYWSFGEKFAYRIGLLRAIAANFLIRRGSVN